MSERAQALEHLHRLARDIGDVRDVAGRRSDPDREHRQMLARLGQWRGGILTVIDILAASAAPPVGVSPVDVVASVRAVINEFLDPETPMRGDDAQLASFLRTILRAKDKTARELRSRIGALQPALVVPVGVSPQPTLCNNCMKSERYVAADGCSICNYCGFVQPAFLAPVEPTPDKRTTGLHRKFIVTRTDGKSAPGQKHDGCDYFVLDLTHDPHAAPAVRAYADSCRADYPLLAADLDAKLSPASPEPPLMGGCSFRGHAWVGNAVVTAKACICGALTVMPTAEVKAQSVEPAPPTPAPSNKTKPVPNLMAALRKSLEEA